MKSPSSLLVVLLLACSSCALLRRDSGPALSGLPAFLPEAKVSHVESFAGEELYNYMNGAAATYLEDGPVRMTAGDVEFAGVSSKVELYTMVSAAAAQRIYGAFAESPGGEFVAVAQGGTLWPSKEPEGIFLLGPHFVRVMTYAADAATGKRVASQVMVGVGRLLSK